MTAKAFFEHTLVVALLGAGVGAVAGGLVSWPVSYNVAMSTIGPSQDRQMESPFGLSSA